jgi:ATP-binding protein involved in chromosome partitioning
MKPKHFVHNKDSRFRHTFAVMSSKGGVGKSTLTSLIGLELTRMGYRVGILDADILGPSISFIMGTKDGLYSEEGAIIPLEVKPNLFMVSSQLLLGKKDEPMVYRAPIVLDLIRQFYEDTRWGDLDVLLIDLPPGTGDTPMTVLQQIPMDGVIMITTPQDMVQTIVGKGINMLKLIPQSCLGIIQNYASFECPTCHQQHPLFGETTLQHFLKTYELPLLASLPLDPRLPNAIDNGKIESFHSLPLQEWLQQWKKEERL